MTALKSNEALHSRRAGLGDRGNAVAVVLLVLAVVSILGIGLLTRSTMDTKFSTAYKNHERLFSLADGAANIAFRWLHENGAAPEKYVPNMPNMQSLANMPEYNNPQYIKPASGSVTDTEMFKAKGMYWPVLSYLGSDTNPQRLAGYEIGKFEMQYWIVAGVVSTERTLNPGGVARGAPRSQASVQIAASKPQKI